MKRLAGIAMLLCLCAVASAQIQNKFWGLELSKCYVSIKSAKDIINDKCEWAFIENNSISAYNGVFGGHNWDFITFLFLKEYTSSILYKIIFSSPHSTENSAITKYYELLEPLVVKYGSPEIHNINEGILAIWSDRNTMNGCSLARIKSESKGGKEFYYVNLEYYNADYLRKACDQEQSEL